MGGWGGGGEVGASEGTEREVGIDGGVGCVGGWGDRVMGRVEGGEYVLSEPMFACC